MVHSQHNSYGGQGALHGAGEDSRLVAAVLRDVLPALARIQSRSPQAMVYGQMPTETIAAVALVSDLGADSLRRLTAYLEAYADKFDGLESCAPLVANAARALAARDYSQCFTLLFEVYRGIAILRMDDPKLPFPGLMKDVSPEARKSGEADMGADDDIAGSSRPSH